MVKEEFGSEAGIRAGVRRRTLPEVLISRSIIVLEFEWHDAKAEANLQAHGVSLDLAKTVFKDPFPVDKTLFAIVFAIIEALYVLFQRGEQRSMSRTTTSSRTVSPPRPMTPEAIERAARADRDAQPLTEMDLRRMRRTPQAKIIRRALDLTQEEFAARYHIPLGTLRDWEQGRAEPDQPTRAYLTLIARDPDHVNRTLNLKAS